MRKHVRILLLAGVVLAFLAGAAAIGKPPPHSAPFCVHYYGECVPPEFLANHLGTAHWYPFGY